MQCPRKACSGVPFGSAGVSCQPSHGVGIVPADLRCDEALCAVQDVPHVCTSSEPQALCPSGEGGYPDPFALSLRSDSGCRTLEHSEHVLTPWLRGAPTAAACDVTADGSAFGNSQGVFVCQKRVQEGKIQLWKNCLDIRVEHEDIVHGSNYNDNSGFADREGASCNTSHHCGNMPIEDRMLRVYGMPKDAMQPLWTLKPRLAGIIYMPIFRKCLWLR